MTAPRRIQLQRARGWRIPENTRVVTRPGPWGNVVRVAKTGMQNFGWGPDGEPLELGPWSTTYIEGGHPAGWWFPNSRLAAEKAVEIYRWRFHSSIEGAPLRMRIDELRGHNLGCWCRLCDRHRAAGLPHGEICGDCMPCHSSVLLEAANG